MGTGHKTVQGNTPPGPTSAQLAARAAEQAAQTAPRKRPVKRRRKSILASAESEGANALGLLQTATPGSPVSGLGGG